MAGERGVGVEVVESVSPSVYRPPPRQSRRRAGRWQRQTAGYALRVMGWARRALYFLFPPGTSGKPDPCWGRAVLMFVHGTTDPRPRALLPPARRADKG